MSRRSNVRSVVTPLAAWDELCSAFASRDSRTVRRHSLAGVVPSVIAVLSMSAVTVVTLVVIVTTVADAGLPIRRQDDAWSRWSSSPTVRFGNNGAIPSSYAPIFEEEMIEFAIDGMVADAAFVAPDR